MPLHYTLASEPPASRRLRRCAPLLLFLGMLAGALVPGLIAGDRPFQTSLCDDLEHAPAACAPRADSTTRTPVCTRQTRANTARRGLARALTRRS